MFRSAGLDPDKPPTTWTEVREAARKIAEANPGVAGYMQMTQNNTGGWQLVANTFAHGGRVQTLNADGTATSTLDNAGTKAALQMLKEMRWSDNSMGSNFMFDWAASTRRSRPVRSACSPPAPTCTPRWCRPTA
ncbi:extracellular solute-binding protein [Tessaracoccus coleopterorum]|uniref:extracellular solute-binding protein n=1 Tax=Tessaracoccus coleopterorum TaxID=2714950 RepID=UPI001E594071|nr:extracellular solute-binding protein [Tessaracoccus coleopterorum]